MPLTPPHDLKKELPLTPRSKKTVLSSRRVIQDIIGGSDRRIIAIVGPCSIHDPAAALEYAEKLLALGQDVADTIYVVMRTYFEKPRTTTGWKGLINDPHLDGSCDMAEGLRVARRLLMEITAMGLPAATELLDPITPQYIAGLLSWAAIGARTTESQTHREMASGLSMPVGFKNGTDGDLGTAINAMVAAGLPQSFLGIDPSGRSSIVQTAGNAHTHIVLRGGRKPNYDSTSIEEAKRKLFEAGQTEVVMVDCSHGNSRKLYREQATVWEDVIGQRVSGNDDIIGLMLESNLEAGRQDADVALDSLDYGVSITDPCISWETTERLVRSAHERLTCGVPLGVD